MEKLVSANVRHVRHMDRGGFLPDVVDDDRPWRYHRDPGFCDGYHVSSCWWQYAGTRFDRDTFQTR